MPRSSRHRRKRRPSTSSTPSTLVRLWILRTLVALGGYRELKKLNDYLDPSDDIARAAGIGERLGSEVEDFDEKAAIKVLRKNHSLAEKKAPQARLPKALATNCVRIAKLIGLDTAAQRILAFAVLLHQDALLQSVTEMLGDTNIPRIYRLLAILLDLPEGDVRDALAPSSVLAQSGLVKIEQERSYGHKLHMTLDVLSQGFADRMLSDIQDLVSLFRDTIIPAPTAELTLADYEHVQTLCDIMIPLLHTALDTGRMGVNILLHGQPGTGKSQFARVLAAALGTTLFQVSSEDDDGDPIGGEKRLRAYRAALCVVGHNKTLLVFDGAEDVFSGGGYIFSPPSPAQKNKAWVNRTLESNPVPCLWITNTISGIDPAFIRRFDAVIELPIPPPRQRARVIQSVCGDLITPTALKRLARSEHLAPAVIARAATVARTIAEDLIPGGSCAVIEHLVNHTLIAQGHAGLPKITASSPQSDYEPACVNVETDLVTLADGIARTHNARLCLYGPPGTGKTAFAHWLAERLDKPLLIRRASDLIGPYVGESERNLAAAFRKASQDDAVFLLDEVDSFLLDRRRAERHWEVTLVNEMLTQMESFEGVFIAATNLMDSLDPAALRRFDLKLHFDYLKPDQAWHLLQHHATALGLPPPDVMHQDTVARLSLLTPGDFATVARQAQFRTLADCSELIAALTDECAAKPMGPRHAIGFIQ